MAVLLVYFNEKPRVGETFNAEDVQVRDHGIEIKLTSPPPGGAGDAVRIVPWHRIHELERRPGSVAQ